jgi:hypothetical protein
VDQRFHVASAEYVARLFAAQIYFNVIDVARPAEELSAVDPDDTGALLAM